VNATTAEIINQIHYAVIVIGGEIAMATLVVVLCLSDLREDIRKSGRASQEKDHE